MKLYTCIFEFDGSTYISQNQALNEIEALDNWTGDIAQEDLILDTHGAKCVDLLIKGISQEDNELVLLNNTKFVWCISCQVNHHLALLHIIQTDH